VALAAEEWEEGMRARLRNGTEPEPDRPIWYELELEECYEDIMDWLRRRLSELPT
jgi:hypothetical protein